MQTIAIVGLALLLFAGSASVSLAAAGSEKAKKEPPAAAIAKPDKNGSYGEKVEEVMEIHNFSFQPQELTVAPGTTVVWTNLDGVQHNVHVVADKKNPLKEDVVAGLLSKGQKVAVTFNKEGTYSYHCDPHTFMKGTIIVKVGADKDDDGGKKTGNNQR